MGLPAARPFGSPSSLPDPAFARRASARPASDRLARFGVRAAEGLQPAGLTASLAAAIGRVDRDLALTFQPVSETLSPFYTRERLLALLSGFFGMLALILAAMDSTEQRRTRVSQRRSNWASAWRWVPLLAGW